MRELNARYRHGDYATNVLSFPAELPAGVDLPLLGDIVVCAPVVNREAAAQRKAPRAHWAHMLVHGTLHLLGHDHERAREAARMEALEKRVLAGLKFPDPYQEQ
jgi:probable rRNA maturation factor